MFVFCKADMIDITKYCIYLGGTYTKYSVAKLSKSIFIQSKLRQKYLESDIFVQILFFYTWILKSNISFNVIDQLLNFELVWMDNWDSKDFKKDYKDFYPIAISGKRWHF